MVRKRYEKVIVWEVSWRLNKTATYWPPALLAITALLSRSPGCSTGGPEGPASAGTWFSLLELQQLTPNSDLQLTRTSCSTGLYNCLTPTCFSERRICTQFNPSTVKVIPLISSTGCTCYLYRCISYLTARPGRRSICYSIYRTFVGSGVISLFRGAVSVFYCPSWQSVYIYIYIYIYIWLNRHNRHFLTTYFLLILANCRIGLMIFGENWLINLP